MKLMESSDHKNWTLVELSLLLKDELKDRLRFNLLTLKPELDGIELPDTDITYLYVKMGECGWKVPKTSAIDAIIYASQKNCYDPVQVFIRPGTTKKGLEIIRSRY